MYYLNTSVEICQVVGDVVSDDFAIIPCLSLEVNTYIDKSLEIALSLIS